MIKKKILLDIYKTFSLIRVSQNELISTYHPENKMRCPIHFCQGQEALASVAKIFFRKNDYVLSHHRSHGYYLAKGCSLDSMVAEFYGKKTGSNMGLAGSQEISMHAKKFYSGTILSGMFAISLGTAFKQKNSKTQNITVTIIGDGGMEEGIVYETLNLASLKSLPILFICENNNFSVHTNIKERTNLRNFKNLVETFGIKYKKISDFKIEKIYTNTKEAFNFVRNNQKPLFLEFDTMRHCGHVGPENDDAEFNYRGKYLKIWKRKDAFEYMKKKLKKQNDVLNKIDQTNKKNVLKSINKARKSKFLNYKKSIEFNFIKSFSSKIKKFTKNNSNFQSNQNETRLKPY